MLELDLKKAKLVFSPMLTHLERRVQTSEPEVQLFLCTVDYIPVLYSTGPYVGHAKRTRANTHRHTPKPIICHQRGVVAWKPDSEHRNLRDFSPSHLCLKPPTQGLQSAAFPPRKTSPIGDALCGKTKPNFREWVSSAAVLGP